MLSAIAARKARLGLGDSKKEPRNIVKEATKSSSPSVIEEETTASGKRKHVVPPPSPPTKPSKRNKTKLSCLLTPQDKDTYPKDDVIAVENDQFNSRDEEDVGLGEIAAVPTVMASTTAENIAARRWSPSVPHARLLCVINFLSKLTHKQTYG